MCKQTSFSPSHHHSLYSTWTQKRFIEKASQPGCFSENSTNSSLSLITCNPLCLYFFTCFLNATKSSPYKSSSQFEAWKCRHRPKWPAPLRAAVCSQWKPHRNSILGFRDEGFRSNRTHWPHIAAWISRGVWELHCWHAEPRLTRPCCCLQRTVGGESATDSRFPGLEAKKDHDPGVEPVLRKRERGNFFVNLGMVAAARSLVLFSPGEDVEKWNNLLGEGHIFVFSSSAFTSFLGAFFGVFVGQQTLQSSDFKDYISKRWE